MRPLRVEEPKFLQRDKIPRALGRALTQDEVIKDFNLQELPRADEVPRHSDVGLGRTGITAGMVMLCEAPVYVLSPPGGTNGNTFQDDGERHGCTSAGGCGTAVDTGFTAKGLPCLKANRSIRLRRTRPAAR